MWNKICSEQILDLSDSEFPWHIALYRQYSPTQEPDYICGGRIIHPELILTGDKFRQYGYGEMVNLDVYNQPTPPDYELAKITAPVRLYYSENDWLTGLLDVQKLNASLPNEKSVLVPYQQFNHLDFMWAIDVRAVLYDDVINNMNKH